MSIDFRHPNRPAGRLGVRAADPSRVGQRHVDTLQRTLKIECCLPFVTVVKARRAGNRRNFVLGPPNGGPVPDLAGKAQIQILEFFVSSALCTQ